MMKPKVLIPIGLGINSERELKKAFEMAGAEVDYILWNDLMKNPNVADKYQGMGLAGGFAMGDHLGAGQSLANRIRASGFVDKLQEKLYDAEYPMYIVCNSKQLVGKLDLAPVEFGTTFNDSGKHETGFWDLAVNQNNDSVWLSQLKNYRGPIFAPISHGEGRVVLDDENLKKARELNLIALTYVDGHMSEFFRSSRGDRYNPNGSIADIAGFAWANNLVLFPHFERLLMNVQRPDRAELVNTGGVYMPTNIIFTSAVKFMREK
jgi:phosphoribosylformylglycinamidine synthase